jgi:leucyl-tRNA synthetase
MQLKLSTFTTEPHTTYGASFMVIAPEHPIVLDLVKGTKYEKDAKEFIKKCKKFRIEDPTNLEKQKEGFFIGRYVINHLNGRKMPLFIANFAIMDYGTGIVKCTPTHDQRDFEFAKKYDLGFYPVIDPPEYIIDPKKMGRAYTNLSEGKMVNAGKFTGMDANKARKAVADYTVKIGHGRKTIQYKMRDWLISRQRYWGTPIPIIYCESCGAVPVPEKDLPVLLPEKVKFGKGNPLETNKKFLEVKCPSCGKKGKRETDTMDTFFDSSWYFLRYCDNENSKKPFGESKVKYWSPVDQYIGGAEHATMHLMYARFFVKALRDLGFLEFDEPFKKLFNQGMLHGEDGVVMSKSRGNVVLPEEISKKYGIDTARFFLISIASPNKDIQWSEEGIEGSSKFVKKVVEFSKNVGKKKSNPNSNSMLEHKSNKAIKEITEHIENFEYNLAVIKLREFFNYIENKNVQSKEVFEIFLKLLSPFCPHVTEELWESLGNKSFLSLETWPSYDEKKIDERFDKEEKMVDKLVSDINHIKKLTGQFKAKVYVYVLPNEVEIYGDVSDIELFAVNDKEKYDPENKSKKVRPGRPGIYLE